MHDIEANKKVAANFAGANTIMGIKVKESIKKNTPDAIAIRKNIIL